MIMPIEKTYRGKFRYQNKKGKHGRISLSSKVTKLPDFPFKHNSTVVITFRDDYLIIEPLYNDKLEPIKKSFQCSALDCDNNKNGVCGVEHCVDNKGFCITYSFNRNYFDKSLKDKVEKEK